ncbi:45551_t:CDS:2, partial [Gigaspora margarita]
TRQLVDLYNEIRKVCEGSEVYSNIPSVVHSPDDLVYNSFDNALMESEPKIKEIDAGRSFPSLVRYPHFYEKTKNTYDQEFS